jgi:hypothetical protein
MEAQLNNSQVRISLYICSIFGWREMELVLILRKQKPLSL